MNDVVDKTFESLFALEDIRQIWRDTAPTHRLSPKQIMELTELLESVKSNADFILDNLKNYENHTDA
jgi:hypothetical protein